MGLGIKTKYRRIKYAFKYGLSMLQVSQQNELDALLLCHALEKGMGIQNVRHGYGKEKAEKLINSLHSLKTDKKEDSYAFKEGLTVLKTYFEFQQKDNVDISNLKQMSNDLMQIDTGNLKAGYNVLNRCDFSKGKAIDFESFINSRHSMRTYSNEKINDSEILRAVDMAKRAPSACNRQPWKFYYSFDLEKIDQIRKAVPKQSFLDDIPYFGVVTVEKGLFSPTEVNQWYINGGIFTSFLVLAFHNLNIGSIILQYPVFSDSSKSLKDLLDIKESEEIITIIGFGKYPEEAKCIVAQRRDDTDIAIKV